MLTNEVRRIKQKLGLIEGEEVPVNKVLFDLLDIVADYHDQKYNPRFKQMMVDNLKQKYIEDIRKFSTETPKQKKLDL